MLPRLFQSLAFFAGMLAAALPAQAVQPFTIRDIRVEGVQRTEAGTVFTYLPLKVGDRIDDEKSARAIKALYATGFYSDVRLEADGDVLIVFVQERPAIAQIDIEGAKEFTKDNLKDGLKQAGIAEAKIYDKSLLDRAEKEIKRQYTSRGYYGAKVTTTVTPLERNRVSLRFDIEEGDVTKIADINIIGAKDFSERELLRTMKLTTPGWLTWWTKDDQYSKQQLTADLESLRSHYLNKGYLEFNIESTQVSITPDREKIYITIVITEGPVYRLGDIKLAGDLIVKEEELRALLLAKPGDTFSREKIVDSSKRITDRLGNDGYSFANVNPVPEVDREKRLAVFTFFVDPGRRVYVRRVNVAGNQKTQDEVVRREMRQLESSWYSLEKISRSKERLQRTGYFQEVNIETPAVPGTSDQVDVNVNVTERNTGQFTFGLGYSGAEGVTLQASVSQSNILGTGNLLAFQVNNGEVNKVYSFTYMNPYWTADGVARGFDFFRRDVNTQSLSVADYRTYSTGAGMRFGVPISEYDGFQLGFTYEITKLAIDAFSPIRYQQFVNEFGEKSDTFRTNFAFARDTRDSLIWPTRGTYNEFALEVGLPPADLTYYRATFQTQYLWTPERFPWLTFFANAEFGLADGYKDKPLPFFKNFYAGGTGSIRGFESASLGPKDINGDNLGGDRRFVANFEVLFPMPGNKEKNVRLGAFMDMGNVWGPGEKIRTQDLRASVGAAVAWDSPMGPLRFSLGYPIKKQEGDLTERFQFQLGKIF
ncbi:outer membrane protein assembly factor BamA [Usitatibacter palustris]|uniref:Outer membrane protein assembly factor BamA n=1 Tax=Usitatibacter palustris TaxID=2732487 RepID=A0A6M4H6X4_9PROT|nr:outer membrane protein assembly factor BamA [Usitatibacter palustris]QJR14154.1 Outer membrane protein assembly factor BamA [Usitatibacter palustris]